eukprot:284816299_2
MRNSIQHSFGTRREPIGYISVPGCVLFAAFHMSHDCSRMIQEFDEALLLQSQFFLRSRRYLASFWCLIWLTSYSYLKIRRFCSGGYINRRRSAEFRDTRLRGFKIEAKSMPNCVENIYCKIERLSSCDHSQHLTTHATIICSPLTPPKSRSPAVISAVKSAVFSRQEFISSKRSVFIDLFVIDNKLNILLSLTDSYRLQISSSTKTVYILPTAMLQAILWVHKLHLLQVVGCVDYVEWIFVVEGIERFADVQGPPQETQQE